MSIQPHETKIQGAHFLKNGKIVADDNCDRIEHLIKNYLEYIKTDEAGWNILYQEPSNGRYWEKTFPQSESHGGGAPSLHSITIDEARLKYGPF